MTIGFGFADTAYARGFHGNYANPHATIGIKEVPTNIKQVMRLCRFYYMQDALLGAIVDKMSEYPITQIVITEKDKLTEKTRDKWEYLLDVALDLRNVMRTINIDKYVFGNAFYYLYFPFVRYCICQSCGHMVPIGALSKLRVQPDDSGPKFTLKVNAACPNCSGRGDAERTFKVEDRKSEARNGLAFVRLNPLRMELEYASPSGARDWYWNPPFSLRDGLIEGVRSVVDTTEMRVLEAIYRGQKIRLNKDRLWVAQADGMPGLWEGWGIPPIFRVLENVYCYKVLRRANEALAQEHVTPLRILSPSGTGDISPQRTMNLSDWQGKVRRELYRWKRDPNHIMLSPMPVNIEQLGGQARVMMVASEMEAEARVIGAGLGCPIEMIWGGLNWSGASVSLRVLENHFLNDRETSERMLAFLVPKLSTYFRMPRITTELSEFKMADDVQQQANAVNLMLQGFLSRESVVNDMGYDSDEEFRRLEGEHEKLNKITMKDNIEAAHMNTVVMALEAKAQVLMQFELELVQQGLQMRAERQRLADLGSHVQKLHDQGYATPHEFDQSSMILGRLDPQMQQLVMDQWAQTMPTVSAMLRYKLQADSEGMAMAQAAQEGAAPPQQAGAAEGPGMDPGAEGPYAEGTGGAAGGAGGYDPSMDLGGDDGMLEPLPEQKPPTRQRQSASPV